MKDSSRCRHKQLEKISFEEVMGAAGMSGFGALLEQWPGIEERGWQLATQSRLKFLMQGAALAEKLGRQNDTLRSLNEPLTRRLTSLREALRILSLIGCAVPAHLLHAEAADFDAHGLGLPLDDRQPAGFMGPW